MADDDPVSTTPTADASQREGPVHTVGSRAKWELLEILAAVILAAESLRIVGSVTAGIINGATAHVAGGGEQRVIGRAMVMAAGFSDGPGIVLLLVSLGLLWWRAEYWTGRLRRSLPGGAGDSGLPEEVSQFRRLRVLARWTILLFGLASAGALAFFVGTILVVSAGGNSASAQWQAYANDLFSIAYLIIALAGVVGARKLAGLCRADLHLVDSAG
jgi:hypothetical protein